MPGMMEQATSSWSTSIPQASKASNLSIRKRLSRLADRSRTCATRAGMMKGSIPSRWWRCVCRLDSHQKSIVPPCNHDSFCVLNSSEFLSTWKTQGKASSLQRPRWHTPTHPLGPTRITLPHSHGTRTSCIHTNKCFPTHAACRF